MAEAPIDIMESSVIVSLRGIPAVEPLTKEAFAALPKKKISSLWTSADGRAGYALRVRLAPLSNCAIYLLCVGILGVADRRMRDVTMPKAFRALGEAIFAYQLDWRYPQPFGISMTALDEEPARDVAVRRAYAHAFFSLIERTKSYFASSSAQPMASYMIALTRYILGKRDVAAFDAWLDAMITRLERVAPDPIPYVSSSLYDHPSREAWQAAVELRHGRALPLELLDVTTEGPSPEAWPDLVRATFERFSPEVNPLLQPREVLTSAGIERPYGVR